jgi:hypothetical protein
MIARPKKWDDLRSRRTLLVSSFRELDIDAPIPSYQLDKVLRAPPLEWADRHVRDFRRSANFAARRSIDATREYFETPADIASALMFFDTLLQIERLIGQIQKVDVAKIQRLIRPSNKNLARLRAIRVSGGAAKSLQSSLVKKIARIEIFTRQNSIVTLPKGNNRDPFTANFIWFFGRKIGIGPDFLVKIPLFARILAAAWRDLDLPLEDHRGRSREPLERWFSDRLRHYTSPHDEVL